MSLGWFPCLDVNNRENAKLQSACTLPEIFTAIVEYECSEKKNVHRVTVTLSYFYDIKTRLHWQRKIYFLPALTLSVADAWS